jgi:meiotically up-regulated gene 157 (Mug157) protein
VFQLDQQCYPLLELCDFSEQFPKERASVQNILQGDTVLLILQMLEEYRDSTTGLYKTEDTLGDDAVEYPFHFSSHVLLWHTISSLSAIYKSFSKITSVDPAELAQLAIQTRAATLKHFVSRHSQTGEVFAYLTDGSGKHTFYHDANDIPTLFARTGTQSTLQKSNECGMKP